MNTLKSAALIVVLLAVLYGVYVALNKPDPPGLDAPPTGTAETPLIEYSSYTSAAAGSAPSAPLVREPMVDVNPAAPATGRSVRGGAFQPEIDPATLPPPVSPPPLAPADPTTTTSAGGPPRSAYELPAASAVATATAELQSSDGVRQASSLESPTTSSVATASATSSPALAAYALRRDLQEAERLASEGKFKSALAKLSPHYFQADLTSDDRGPLSAWLDALAAKVIYSRDHLLAAPHQVRRGETLFDIAQQYNVEYRLLQNINREVREPDVLVAGTELKVVPGPFRADVNLTTSEITLVLGELYAGRFPFAVGDQPPQPGEYKVIDKKSQQKTYVGFDGRVIPGNDPANPYGEWWLSLGGEVCIHGSPVAPTAQTLGCISLSPQDARDVYGILSIGSEVKLHR